jgi:head-tail adaptor
MRSRKLSKRIEIWQTSNVSDGFGGNTVDETLITSSWAEIITLNDVNRSTDIGITSATNSIKVRLRKRKDITYNSINQYLKYRGFKYIIKNQPFNVGFRDDAIEIIAVKEDLRSVSEITPIVPVSNAHTFGQTFDNTFK